MFPVKILRPPVWYKACEWTGLERASSSTSFNIKEVKILNDLLDAIKKMVGVKFQSNFYTLMFL